MSWDFKVGDLAEVKPACANSIQEHEKLRMGQVGRVVECVGASCNGDYFILEFDTGTKEKFWYYELKVPSRINKAKFALKQFLKDVS